MSEQRKTKRINVRIPVTVQPKESGTQRHPAEILNISEGGAFIRSDAFFAPGTRLLVSISFPEMTHLDGVVIELDKELIASLPTLETQESSVRWGRENAPSGFGIAFVSLGKDTKLFLAKLVNYFEKLERAGVSFT